MLTQTSILVLAGSQEQLDRYDQRFASDDESDRSGDPPCVIIGGGRVGRAVARNLQGMGIPSCIVEKQPDRIRANVDYVEGDAADLGVLQRAGIDEAPSVVVTTHDDDVNVYLTNYCRRLRADAQIIARARLDRNVSTLHRAGADFVLSYASTGANAIWNMLSADNTLQLAEGVDVFRVPVPRELAGRALVDAHIREDTGCTVVALITDGGFHANPDPAEPLPDGGDLALIGDSESEHRFLSRYRPSTR